LSFPVYARPTGEEGAIQSLLCSLVFFLVDYKYSDAQQCTVGGRRWPSDCNDGCDTEAYEPPRILPGTDRLCTCSIPHGSGQGASACWMYCRAWFTHIWSRTRRTVLPIQGVVALTGSNVHANHRDLPAAWCAGYQSPCC
jgi:hypothetical protein